MDTNLDPTARYRKSHEWSRPEGDDIYTCGVSDFAQSSLGDVVFVDLESAEVGTTLNQEDIFGTIESVKSANDLYMPMSGEIVEINDALIDEPEMVNEDCYGAGWMIKLRATNASEWEALLDGNDYSAHTEAQ